MTEKLYVGEDELPVLLEKGKEQLAREFVGLIFPRLINSFTEQSHLQLQAMRQMKEGARKGKEFGLEKEINEAQDKLKKALSEEVMQKVMDKMSLLLEEELTAEELAYAIYQEKITIKISGIAAQLESAFEEAVGEA